MTERAAIASVRRLGDGAPRVDQDLVAVEAPLSIDVIADDGTTHALGLVMRTPGDDRDLVLGLLHGEGVIRAASDVEAIDIETIDTAAGDRTDVARVRVSASVPAHRLPEARRQTLTSACGLCGRLSREYLDARARRAGDGASALVLRRDVVLAMPAALRSSQTVFAETGGLHAAALFDVHGVLTRLREDVGRHNAVDKAIGSSLEAGSLGRLDVGLAVSGRVAYEIVQKAAVAGLAAIVAVGAPSSLAVEAARATGLTLVGFVRDGRFNIYTGAERVLD